MLKQYPASHSGDPLGNITAYLSNVNCSAICRYCQGTPCKYLSFHSYNILNISYRLPHGKFPRPVRMDKLIAQPLYIVKVVQAVYESLVLHIIGAFRRKLPPFTHKPQIIVKRPPRLFLPLFISSRRGCTGTITTSSPSLGQRPCRSVL